jgi:hypothetical protein
VDFETEEAIEAVIDDHLPSELAEFGAQYGERCERSTGCSWTPFATARCPVWDRSADNLSAF